jgi:hypothetical protein
MIIIKTNIEAKRGENALKWEEKEIDLDIDMLEFIDSYGFGEWNRYVSIWNVYGLDFWMEDLKLFSEWGLEYFIFDCLWLKDIF